MQKIMIENTKARIWGIGDLFLFPGQNSVDAAEWDKAKKETSTIEALESGEIVETFSGAKAQTILAGDLSAVTPKQAIKMVETTFHISQLELWGATEKRPAVARAINEQIAKLKPANPKPEKAIDENNLTFL